MKLFLEKHLRIYAHESSRFLWITGVCFALFFVTAIFRNYVDAAFLKRYGPQYIPWMLVINAGVTFVVMGVIDRLGRRFVDQYLLAGCLAIYAASSFGLFFAVKADLSIAYPILYQLLNLLDSLLLVYLWNIAGDLFDARQGKRIFPLITAGQVLGSTLGSFATKPISVALGEDPALLVFAAVCMGIAVFLTRTGFDELRQLKSKGTSQKNQSVKLWEVPALMGKYPMVRYLIITGLVPNIVLPIFVYQFGVIAHDSFASEQALITFLSIFRGCTTALTFVLLFFMGRLYTTMGISNASLVQPVNFAVLFAALSGAFNIYVAAYGQFTNILIQRAISGPVNKILYGIIPSELVVWSRTFIRGTVLKVGMLAGSLSMIFFKPVLSARQFSFIALAATLYWLFETLLFRKHYTRMLKQVIVEKQIDFDQIDSMRTFDSGGSGITLATASVEDRTDEPYLPTTGRKAPQIDPDVALRLLDDENPRTRAEAAASFALSKDMRAVGRLLSLLGDTDDDVRQSAVDALIAYREKILPFLEVALLGGPPRAKQGILEVIRLSGLKEFEMIPFLGAEVTRAYGNLIALRLLKPLNGGVSVQMLRTHLEALNEEILSLIFYALWVSHADMRLMYQALKSESSSIAVELVENSIHKDITPYLLPLIDSIPLDEKIEKGQRLLPLIRNENLERILNILAHSHDSVTKMLAFFAIGERFPDSAFIPAVEAGLNDESRFVREIAEYAFKRCMNEVVPMPEIIEKITKLQQFGIFEGMGVRELHAIASVVNVEQFAAGDVLIKEGEENSSIYLVVSGKVAIYGGYGTPDEKHKVTLGEGAFLGELSLFTRMKPNATCVAAELTEAYVLRHHQFQEIMKVYPQIGINLCGFFTMKLRQVEY